MHSATPLTIEESEVEITAIRAQDMNRLDAFARLHELVNSVATPPRVRKPTRPTVGSRQRRLEGKAQRGQIKVLRGRVEE